MDGLVYKNEKPLLAISVVVGVIFWLLVVIGTFGLALLFMLFAFVMYLFAQSAFISHLRGNCVELAADQYPDLHRQYLESCDRLGVAAPPTAYLMMSDGILNALAARFLRRYYVVVFSSIIEALKSQPEAVRFYFGHELAHVLRGHLNLVWLKLPASALPLLGAAYRRAQEYTCDLHGMAACASTPDAVAALAVLASGGEKLPQLNTERFVEQQSASGGFWMSYHELTGDYPWLCKRIANVLRASAGAEALLPPRRSFWAGVLAFFTPRLGPGGGSVSMLISIAIVGILAAIAIPAYRDYTIRAEVAPAFAMVDEILEAAAPYVEENRRYPATLDEIGLSAVPDSEAVSRIDLVDDGIEMTLAGTSASVDGKTVLVSAYQDDEGEIGWECVGGTLEMRYRPVHCRP